MLCYDDIRKRKTANLKKGGMQMFNERLFRSKIVLNGLTLSKVSALIGINETTMQRKIKNHGSFTRDEIGHLGTVLNLSDDDLLEIFFAEKLT